MRLILLLTLFTSCAAASLQPVELRTYDICTDYSGFCYQYKVCARKLLGICIKHKIATDKIEADFKNKEQIKQLFDMNFILKVRQKPL